MPLLLVPGGEIARAIRTVAQRRVSVAELLRRIDAGYEERSGSRSSQVRSVTRLVQPLLCKNHTTEDEVRLDEVEHASPYRGLGVQFPLAPREMRPAIVRGEHCGEHRTQIANHRGLGTPGNRRRCRDMSGLATCRQFLKWTRRTTRRERPQWRTRRRLPREAPSKQQRQRGQVLPLAHWAGPSFEPGARRRPT